MLLGSTPLEMDDLIYGHVTMMHDGGGGGAGSGQHFKSFNVDNSRQQDDENSSVLDEKNGAGGEYQQQLINELRDQVRTLNEQLSRRDQENADLNACLIKQTTLGENLSSVLRVSEEKNRHLESLLEKSTLKLESLQAENG